MCKVHEPPIPTRLFREKDEYIARASDQFGKWYVYCCPVFPVLLHGM